MDSNNYNQVLQKCLNNIDDVKEKLDSENLIIIIKFYKNVSTT